MTFVVNLAKRVRCSAMTVTVSMLRMVMIVMMVVIRTTTIRH